MDEDERIRAMNLLLALRQRLVASTTRAILDRESELLKQAENPQSPLRFGREIGVAAAGLNRVDRLIAALQHCRIAQGQPVEDATKSRPPTDETVRRAFDRFASFVSAVKLEDAARELSRVFQMPLDRAGTATRFFARAIRARPEMADSLASLHKVLAGESSSPAMRQLMMIFGFQAVESQMAIETLRAQQPRPATV
jgi:hypothetical protein